MDYESIVAQMTLEEKCAFLQGASSFGTFAIPSLGVPKLMFSDGPHGMRHQGQENENHLGIGGSLPATCFPTAAAVAQSWDPSLGERIGEALGEEAASQGVACVLGPALNLKRSPLAGRNFEYFSEDPVLAGKMAAAYVRGIQGKGVAACPKHFAANSQEARRQASNSVVDERTLRELYLRAFEIVVREADPWAIMSSYNLVNGVYANENRWLLSEVLRYEWGFDGAVVTDWGASNDHVDGVAAGSNFEMPGPGLAEARTLARAVRCGRLSQEVLDQRVSEGLKLVMRTRTAVEACSGTAFEEDEHHQLARKVAAQSIVLLKNESAVARGALAEGAPLLPLAEGTKVAVLGDFAMTPRYQGAGSSLVNCTKLDTLSECIQDERFSVVGIAKGFNRDGSFDDDLLQEGVSLAREAEVALVCLGLNELVESEGIDRRDMRLSDNQIAFLHAVAKENPNTVVFLSAGAPVEMDWARDARAILHLALGGQAGASAALDVLAGRVSPSGKLAETWYQRLEDTPTAESFPSEKWTAEYREGPYVGYRYCLTAGVKPAFAFGFGLSYTTFDYTDLHVEVGEPATGAGTKVFATIKNTGAVAGREVVQLYVAKPNCDVFRPAQELKAFQKVSLEPGGSCEVAFELDETAFRYWNVATSAWEVESGTYEMRVAASSDDIRLVCGVELTGTDAPNPYAGRDVERYRTGDVANVPDAQFAALLGGGIPADKRSIDENMIFAELKHSRSPLLMLTGLTLELIRRRNAASGKFNLNLEFVYNMPLRALGQMSGGITDSGFARAIVREAKGWGLIGAAAGIAIGAATKKPARGVLACAAWTLVPPAAALVTNAVRNRKSARQLADTDATRSQGTQ